MYVYRCFLSTFRKELMTKQKTKLILSTIAIFLAIVSLSISLGWALTELFVRMGD